MIIINQSRAG